MDKRSNPKPDGYWTYGKVQNEILSTIEKMNINRMPSPNEVLEFYGDMVLHGAISKSGGYRKWAKRLNLENAKKLNDHDFIEGEIWRPIKQLDGLYEVSNLGRVRSLDRIDKIGRTHPGQLLKLQKNSNGYLRMYVSFRGKRIRLFVHRLVAESFILNPNGYEEVNHKDLNRTNNHVENLEWCTRLQNVRHARSLRARLIKNGE